MQIKKEVNMSIVRIVLHFWKLSEQARSVTGDDEIQMEISAHLSFRNSGEMQFSKSCSS